MTNMFTIKSYTNNDDGCSTYIYLSPHFRIIDRKDGVSVINFWQGDLMVVMTVDGACKKNLTKDLYPSHISKAIIENSMGQTTEIIKSKIMPTDAKPWPHGLIKGDYPKS